MDQEDNIDAALKYAKEYIDKHSLPISNTYQQNELNWKELFNRNEAKDLSNGHQIIMRSKDGTRSCKYELTGLRRKANVYFPGYRQDLPANELHQYCVIESEYYIDFKKEESGCDEDDEISCTGLIACDGLEDDYAALDTPLETTTPSMDFSHDFLQEDAISSNNHNNGYVNYRENSTNSSQRAATALNEIHSALNIEISSISNSPTGNNNTDQRKQYQVEVVEFELPSGESDVAVEKNRVIVSRNGLIRYPFALYDVMEFKEKLELRKTKKQKTVCVIAYIKGKNTTCYKTVVIEPTLFSKTTVETQFAELAKQVNPFQKMFDGKVAKKSKDMMDVYLNQFVLRPMQEPLARLRHTFKLGPLKVQKKNYFIYSNAITKVIDTQKKEGMEELVRTIKADELSQSFAGSGIYWDEHMYNILYESLEPSEAPTLPAKIIIKPFNKRMQKIINRSTGSHYVNRMILNMAKQKLSQSFHPLLKDVCGCTPSVLILGSGGLGKSTNIMSAVKSIGIAHRTTCGYKTKDQSKAGIRESMDKWKNFALVFEDTHLPGISTQSYSQVQLIFYICSTDGEQLKSTAKRGQATAIITQTANRFLLPQQDTYDRQTMRRFALEIWLDSDKMEDGDLWNPVRTVLNEAYLRMTPLFINTANHIEVPLYEACNKMVTATRKKYGKRCDIEWYTQTSLIGLDSIMLSAACKLLKTFFGFEDIDWTKKYCQWYKTVQIRRPAEFIRDFRMEATVGDFGKQNLGYTNSVPTLMPAVAYGSYFIIICALNIGEGVNDEIKQLFSNCGTNIKISHTTDGHGAIGIDTSISGLLKTIKKLSDIIQSYERFQALKFLCNHILTPNYLKRALYCMGTAGILKLHRGKKGSMNVNAMQFSLLGGKHFVLDCDVFFAIFDDPTVQYTGKSVISDYVAIVKDKLVQLKTEKAKKARKSQRKKPNIVKCSALSTERDLLQHVHMDDEADNAYVNIMMAELDRQNELDTDLNSTRSSFIGSQNNMVNNMSYLMGDAFAHPANAAVPSEMQSRIDVSLPMSINSTNSNSNSSMSASCALGRKRKLILFLRLVNL